MLEATHKIAWAAGFFDGEGCFTSAGNKTLCAKVQVCDRDMLEQFYEFVGFGNLSGPRPPSGFGKQPRWLWSSHCASDVYAMFLGFKPYLSERRTRRFVKLFQTWLAKDGCGHRSRGTTPKQRLELFQSLVGSNPYGSIRKALKKWPDISEIRGYQIASTDQRIAYISGKMRGLPEFGFPLFDKAAEKLRAANWTIYSPAEMDREQGFDPNANGYDFHIIQALKRDFDVIKSKCNALIRLPNHYGSEGADAERVIADKYGLAILDYEQLIQEAA